MRRSARLLIPLIAALACRPSAHRGDRSFASADAGDTAQPPLVSCMHAVLATSPMVERRDSLRLGNERARLVVLRNPPSERAVRLLVAIEPKQGTPRQLAVSCPWPRPWRGTGMVTPIDPKIADMEGEALTDMGSSLAREIRAQCAPDVPGELACARVEQGRTQRCVVAI